MYIQIVEGWRYGPGARQNVIERVRRAREAGGGTMPLQPDPPGLIARAFGTSENDPETGVGVWIWESREAADAYAASRPGPLVHRTEQAVDTSAVVTRGFEGLYFGHR